MAKLRGIYKISSVSNPLMFYIGSSMNIRKRWDEHKRRIIENKACCPILGNYFRKHGIGDMFFEIIEKVDIADKEFLIEREQFYIDTLKPTLNASKTARTRYGSKNSPEANNNIIKALKDRPHPTRGKKMPPSHGRKISEALMGRKADGPTRKKLSEIALKAFKDGRVHPMRGKRHTEETKKKMRKPRSPQAIENIRRFRKENPVSEETRKKLSLSGKGRIPWNKGKKMSESACKKMSDAKKGKPSTNKGKKASLETKKKLSISHLGQVPFMKGKHYPPDKVADMKRKKKETMERNKLKNNGKRNLQSQV
jgi:group I intron endonuclease